MAKQLNTDILDIVGSPTITYDGIASFTKNNGFTIKSSAYTNSLVIILKLYYQTFSETNGANTIMRESKTGSNTAIYLDTYYQYRVVWYSAEYGKVTDSDLEIYKFRPDTYCFLRITYTNSSIMGEILKDNITVTTTLEEALASSSWINLSWSKTVSDYFTNRLFQIGASDVFGWGGTIDLSNSSINGQKMFIEQSYNGTKIQLRHDTAANWTSVNPVLLEGEVGIETDTRKQKFGDGVTAWNSLPYDVGSTALQSITSSNVTNALGYTPVNKAGDTMTGNLDFKYSDFDLSLVKSNNVYNGIELQDTNGNRVARLEAFQKTDGSYGVNLSSKKYNASIYNSITVGFDGNGNWYTSVTTPSDNDNSTKIATTAFVKKAAAGQWVSVNTTLATDVSLHGSGNLSYTLTLPDSTYKYEVLLDVQVNTGSTSGNRLNAAISTDIVSDILVCTARTRTSSTMSASGSIIVPVSTSHKVYLSRNTNYDGTATLRFKGYRRIGTNS